MLNKIIEIVEENIIVNSKEMNSILETNLGYSYRQMADAFYLLTGYSIKKYHIKRKLEYAALMIINKRYKTLTSLAHDLSYNDQAAFTKAFKQEFGITPKEATKENIVTLGKMKINLSIEWGDETIQCLEPIINDNVCFGISEKKFDDIQKLLSLAAFYGMNNTQANIAYEISEINDIDFDSAFEFFNDYLELCTWDSACDSFSITGYLLDDETDTVDLTVRKYEQISPEYIFIYKKFGLLPTESFDLIESYHLFLIGFDEERITSRHIDLYRLFEDNKLNAREIEEILTDFYSHTGLDWEEFLDYLSSDFDLSVEGFLEEKAREDEFLQDIQKPDLLDGDLD